MKVLEAVVATAAQLSAAKDIGDAKGDKARRTKIAALSKQAADLSQSTSSASFPEVTSAVHAVQSLVDLSSKLEETAIRLKVAPPASLEAVEAQKTLDKTRGNVDVMLPALTAAMTTMAHLLSEASALETALAHVQNEVATLTESLSKEKVRLQHAAQSVENAVKLG